MSWAEDVADPRPFDRLTAEMVRARPSVIFDHPDPWPTDVVAAAYAVLGCGAAGRTAREYAAGVGARLPVELYAGIGSAAEYYLQAPEAYADSPSPDPESFVIWRRLRSSASASSRRSGTSTAFGAAATRWRSPMSDS